MTVLRTAILAMALLFCTQAASSAQEIEKTCSVAGLWMPPLKAKNQDCPNGVILHIKGEIQPGFADRLESAIASIDTAESRPQRLRAYDQWLKDNEAKKGTNEYAQVEAALGALTASESAHGLFQPITVELNSGGGNVFAAMEAGRVLRKARAWTTIGMDQYGQSNCASACTLLFIAGANRLFNADWLDLHRPSLPASELAKMELSDIEARNRELKAILFAYAEEMGVDRRFVEMSYSIPIDGSVPLTEFQAREINAAGMIDSEYDFIKGTLVRELKLGQGADEGFAFYLGREQVVRGCMEQAYRQALAQGASQIDAVLFGAYDRQTMKACWDRSYEAYPVQNDLNIPSEVQGSINWFAEKS